MTYRFPRLFHILAAAVLLAPGAAAAEAFPDKPVRLMVPYGPGGGTDTIGRIIASALEPLIGQPVVVVNRSGGTGSVGAAEVATGPADGYTMLFTDAAAMSVKPQTDDLPYEAEDFSVVTSINESYFVLSVPADRPFDTLAEFIEAGKQGQLSYSTSGIGSPFHIATEQIKDLGGIDNLTHIPFAGTGDAVTAALGGHVDAVMSYPNAVMPYLESGQMIALGVSSTEPLSVLPDVPTFQQAGVPFTTAGWKALFVPKAVPEDRRATLEAALLKMKDAPEFIAQMEAIGEVINVRPQAEFEPVWLQEYTEITDTLTKIGLLR